MLSSQTLTQQLGAKAEVGHSHRHTGTVSTRRHSWAERNSVAQLGHSLQSHSQIITGAGREPESLAQHNIFVFLQW